MCLYQTMVNREGLIVIVSTFLVHLLFVTDVPSYVVNLQHRVGTMITLNSVVGVALLLFPLFGLLADVYFTRSRMIQLSLLILVVVSLLALLSGGAAIATFRYLTNDRILLPVYSIFISSLILGIGIFEANAIQFGTDQLLGASSTQLSAFIHWYFWSTHLVQQVLFGGYAVTLYKHDFLNVTLLEERLVFITATVVVILIWMSSLVTFLLFFHRVKKHLYIAKTGINPFKHVSKVLTFAWKNKYPLNRSAFTYCEENPPSRLDLGKEQYGGPFTTE